MFIKKSERPQGWLINVHQAQTAPSVEGEFPLLQWLPVAGVWCAGEAGFVLVLQEHCSSGPHAAAQARV